MKETLPCQIIEDLLPNYIEGILSNESKELVTEHIDTCARCKKEWENMNSSIDVNHVVETKISYLKAINKRFIIILISCIMISVIAFIISVFYSEPNSDEAIFTLFFWLFAIILIIIKFILPLVGAILSFFKFRKTKNKWLIFISAICTCCFLYSLFSTINSIAIYGF